MSLTRKVFSIFLLLAVLPATLHCTLESAGMLGTESCCSSEASHDDDTQDCADFCDTLESKGFRFVKDDALVFPAIVFSKLIATDIGNCIRQVTFVRFDQTDPVESQRRWHFIQRAAPLARSPSILA